MRLLSRWCMIVVFFANCLPCLAVENRHLDLVDRIFQSSSLCWWRPTIVERLMTFKMSDAMWQKMLEPDGFNAVRAAANGMQLYIKRQGLGDLEAIETTSKDRNAKRSEIEKKVDGLKEKITLNIDAKGPYSNGQFLTVRSYLLATGEFLSKQKWTPRDGVAHIKLRFDHKSKTLSATGKGGQIEITVPATELAPQWKETFFNQMMKQQK